MTNWFGFLMDLSAQSALKFLQTLVWFQELEKKKSWSIRDDQEKLDVLMQICVTSFCDGVLEHVLYFIDRDL